MTPTILESAESEIEPAVDVIDALEARLRAGGHTEAWIEAHMNGLYAQAERAGITASELAAKELASIAADDARPLSWRRNTLENYEISRKYSGRSYRLPLSPTAGMTPAEREGGA